nr:hypothetical protein [Tanacetum cinerariifolium]
GVSGLAGRRDGDTLDQVGHGHLDVQLDEIGKGVELNVAIKSQQAISEE